MLKRCSMRYVGPNGLECFGFGASRYVPREFFVPFFASCILDVLLALTAITSSARQGTR
jgi:hypothetical protein